MRSTLILGGGVTGLAAGLASSLHVYEAAERPGGICSSYWMRPGGAERLSQQPRDGLGYQFEIGGGHWIFGGDPAVLALLGSLADLRSYVRRSAVYFPKRRLLVPYPLQNHLSYLGSKLAGSALTEMDNQAGVVVTMQDWLRHHFGETLCREFFFPFHELYTAGLYRRIAPQDGFKSPIDRSAVRRGAAGEGDDQAGYNARFVYPAFGLGNLTGAMAAKCQLHLGLPVVQIEPSTKHILFADGSRIGYERLISTLPLTTMLELSSLSVASPPDPYTSVAVLNLGATRGPNCPDLHWLYVPSSRAGFHRVGFYSAVDPAFLPTANGVGPAKVSIYVERAYQGGVSLSAGDLDSFSRLAVDELREWGFVTNVEVSDVTWIQVAYTWSWPGSQWRNEAMLALQRHDIYPVGRYGRWIFQGIADSIRDGLMVGAALKQVG